jgi:hypothetical protein
VRRQHKVHAGNSDQLVARMTFAGGMSTIMSHAGVSKALTALWKTATIGQGLTRKKMTALLGYESKAYDMYSGDRSGGGGDGDGDGGSNVSPWPETDEQVQQQKDAERKEIRVNIKRSGKGKRGKSAAKAAVAALINEKDNLRSSIHRDEFMAVYACMWRILVGAHLHLTALSNGASKSQQQRRRQQDNNQSTADLDLVIQGTENSLTPRDSDNVRPGKVPGKRPHRDSGNWFGLHSDYCLHAANAASVDFHIFARHPHKEISKDGFFNCLLAMAELWIPRRSAEHVAAFLHAMNTSIVAFLKSPYNAIGFRNFPGPLVFESRTMQYALQSVSNVGRPRGSNYGQSVNRDGPRQQSSGIQANASLGALSWRQGIVGVQSTGPARQGISTSHTRSDRRLSYYQQVGRKTGVSGGRGDANREKPSDHYLRHKTSSFSFGRRTPITVMDSAEDRPGPGQYSPWSAYPFMDPFGAPGSSKGFPFEASSGRESHRSQEMARRRAVAATAGALDSRLLLQAFRHSKLNKHNLLSGRRMSFLGGGATGGRGGDSISRSLYDAERIRLEREANKDWKSRRAHTAKQNQKRQPRAVRGRSEWGIPEPLSVTEFEKRECRMSAPGLRSSMRLPQRVPAEYYQKHPLVSPMRQRRRPKESMSTLCHPSKFSGSRGDRSFYKAVGMRGGRGGVQLKRSGAERRMDNTEKMNEKEKKKKKRTPETKSGQPDEDDGNDDEAMQYYRAQEKAALQLLEFDEEDGDSDTEILWNENEDCKYADDIFVSPRVGNTDDDDDDVDDNNDERIFNKESPGQDAVVQRRSHIAMTALRFLSDRNRSSTAPAFSNASGGNGRDHANANANAEHHLLLVPRAAELFEEKEDGSIPKDREWQQQRSSAQAMMQAFSTRADMKKHMMSRNPHQVHGHRHLSASRTDAEHAWSKELARSKMEARVRGGLEKVLLKRAARKQSREERLKKGL